MLETVGPTQWNLLRTNLGLLATSDWVLLHELTSNLSFVIAQVNCAGVRCVPCLCLHHSHARDCEVMRAASTAGQDSSIGGFDAADRAAKASGLHAATIKSQLPDTTAAQVGC